MINKELWQEFRFDEIFTITRGKRLATLDQVSGDIAYISSSKKNNGVDNYILPPSYMTIYENALTLSNSGSVGYCFYHPYKFVSSDHCTVIEIKDPNIPLDNYIALFLKPIIETMRNKYNFAREINNERLRKEIIILPVNHNKSPEWEYMRNVIKTLSKNVIFNNKEIVAKTKGNAIIDTSKWKEFIVGEIFEIVRGKRLIELDRISGSIPYYSASDYNNGLTDMIANPLFTRKDSLVYTTFGRCYYIEGEFTASDEISILHNNNLNVYNGTFIATIINQDKHKYSFGRKAFQNKFANNIIKLPVNQKGKPDFEFMENYIKSLPYSGSL